MRNLISLIGDRQARKQAVRNRLAFWDHCEEELLEEATSSRVTGDPEVWMEQQLLLLEQECNQYLLAKSWLYIGYPHQLYQRFRVGDPIMRPESSAELREAEEQMASEIAIDKIIEELSLRERYQAIFDRAYSLISVEARTPEEGARRDIARSITSIDVSTSNTTEVKICKLAALLQGERMQVADLEERLQYILASGERFAFRELRGWFISEGTIVEHGSGSSRDGMRYDAGSSHKGTWMENEEYLHTLPEALAFVRAYYPARLAAIEALCEDH